MAGASTLGRNTGKPEGWAAVKSELRLHGVLLGGMLGVMWVVFILDFMLGHTLRRLGVEPRTLDGLWGLIFAPFLHGSLTHIVSNSVPFVVLGWMVLLRDARHFILVTLAGMFFGGMSEWLLGLSGSRHIGASGVIFAYFGFLLLLGWFERKAGSALVSLGIAIFYGGLVFGVLPGTPGVSWEGHLGGFIGGALCARLIGRRSSV